MADERLGTYGLNDAAMSEYLMAHMGREIALARAVKEIVPDARDLIADIRVEEWPEGVTPPEDMPLRIVVRYDDAFVRFLHSLERGPEADAADRKRLDKLTSATLRKRYWALVDHGIEARADGDQPTEQEAERAKNLILAVLAGRGETVAG